VRAAIRAACLVGLPLLLAPASAAARGCTERSEILGKQRCSRFGDAWDVSRTLPWVIGLGPSFAHFPVTGMRFTGAVAEQHGVVAPFSLRGDGLGAWTSISPTLRLAIFPARVFYAGIEGQAGAGLTPTSHPALTWDGPGKPVALPAAMAMHPTGLSFRSLGAVVGVSVPVWRFDVSAEILGGFRALSPDLGWDRPQAASAAAGGCWSAGKYGPVCPSIETGWTFIPHVEPRAGVALRVSPWVTLRALVGFDPFAGGAVSAGALLEIHTRTYDGFYPRRIAGAGETR
jgi:hypothetical protein